MADQRPRFVGTYEHGLDDKGRMVLPAKIRAQLGETGMVAKLDGCLGLWTLDGFDVAYQVTITLGATKQEALAEQRRYIDAYYPGFRDAVALADWGPAGAPGEVAEWIDRFSNAGVTAFICRFASLDQFGQVELFGKHVIPALRRETTRS